MGSQPTASSSDSQVVDATGSIDATDFIDVADFIDVTGFIDVTDFIDVADFIDVIDFIDLATAVGFLNTAAAIVPVKLKALMATRLITQGQVSLSK